MEKKALILTEKPQGHWHSALVACLKKAGFFTLLSTELSECDLVINRKFGMNYCDADLDLIEAFDTPSLNPIQAQRICRDKWLTFLWLNQHSLETPKTWRLNSEIDFIGACFLKTIRGMQGRGVNEFESVEEAKSFCDSTKDHKFIIQEKVIFEKEIRGWILGEKFFWFERSGKNLHLGGEFHVLESVPEEVSKSLMVIQNELGLVFGAVDMVNDGSKWLILDINCYPGLKMMSLHANELVGFFRNLRLTALTPQN